MHLLIRFLFQESVCTRCDSPATLNLIFASSGPRKTVVWINPSRICLRSVPLRLHGIHRSIILTTDSSHIFHCAQPDPSPLYRHSAGIRLPAEVFADHPFSHAELTLQDGQTVALKKVITPTSITKQVAPGFFSVGTVSSAAFPAIVFQY